MFLKQVITSSVAFLKHAPLGEFCKNSAIAAISITTDMTDEEVAAHFWMGGLTVLSLIAQSTRNLFEKRGCWDQLNV